MLGDYTCSFVIPVILQIYSHMYQQALRNYIVVPRLDICKAIDNVWHRELPSNRICCIRTFNTLTAHCTKLHAYFLSNR